MPGKGAGFPCLASASRECPRMHVLCKVHGASPRKHALSVRSRQAASFLLPAGQGSLRGAASPHAAVSWAEWARRCLVQLFVPHDLDFISQMTQLDACLWADTPAGVFLQEVCS